MQNRNIIFFSLFLVVMVAIVVVIMLTKDQKKPFVEITNFEQCVAAGYKVMDSYPRQCTLPNGSRFFVEMVIPER